MFHYRYYVESTDLQVSKNFSVADNKLVYTDLVIRLSEDSIRKTIMDEDQLLDYEEEQEETTDGNKAENGSATDKKIKVLFKLPFTVQPYKI